MFALVAEASASAAAAERTGDARCPSRDAIAFAVGVLLDRSRAPVNADTVAREIEVHDLGDRYVVQIRGRRREFTDDARDCSKRVRVAAVFVALTVAPPDIGLPDLSPEPSPEPPRPPPPQLPPPGPPATPAQLRLS